MMDVAFVQSAMEERPVYWLEKLAEISVVTSIYNPSEWQRAIRKDRVYLSGRVNDR